MLEKNPFPSASCNDNSHVSLGSRGDGGLPFAFYQTILLLSYFPCTQSQQISGDPWETHILFSLCPPGPKRVYIGLPLLWDNKVEED